MSDIVTVITLGFLLGVRHATDADHVVAVTNIVTRRREMVPAAITGLLWGLGHTLTVMAVGSLIILFNLAIPSRLGVAMELIVGVMLIGLGGSSIAAHLPHRRTSKDQPHTHGQAPLASIDRRFGQLPVYEHARPVVVGVIHGLAGSAAVALLVVAAVRDPGWAIAYLAVFGLGTIAGMMLITMSIASAFRLTSRGSEALARRFGFAVGVASIVFGVSFAYRLLSVALALSPAN